MAKQSVGNTALGAAVFRLIEQFQPEETRLFNDPVVKYLVGTPIRALLHVACIRNYSIKRSDDITQGIYGAQICRTRYIDDAVRPPYRMGSDNWRSWVLGLIHVPIVSLVWSM